jgi:hypothetical protein
VVASVVVVVMLKSTAHNADNHGPSKGHSRHCMSEYSKSVNTHVGQRNTYDAHVAQGRPKASNLHTNMLLQATSSVGSPKGIRRCSGTMAKLISCAGTHIFHNARQFSFRSSRYFVSESTAGCKGKRRQHHFGTNHSYCYGNWRPVRKLQPQARGRNNGVNTSPWVSTTSSRQQYMVHLLDSLVDESLHRGRTPVPEYPRDGLAPLAEEHIVQIILETAL